jgi:hypothetical protein
VKIVTFGKSKIGEKKSKNTASSDFDSCRLIRVLHNPVHDVFPFCPQQ